jgi:hypothetical protein
VPAAQGVGDGLDVGNGGRERELVGVLGPPVEELDLDQPKPRPVEHPAHAGRIDPGRTGACEVVGVQSDAREPGGRGRLATLHEGVPRRLTEARAAEGEEAGDELRLAGPFSHGRRRLRP